MQNIGDKTGSLQRPSIIAEIYNIASSWCCVGDDLLLGHDAEVGLLEVIAVRTSSQNSQRGRRQTDTKGREVGIAVSRRVGGNRNRGARAC